MNIFKRLYKFILPYTVKYAALHKVSLFVYKTIVFVLKPFSRSSSVYNTMTSLDRHLGFARVLGPGNVAIQIGIVPKLYSHLFHIARTVGKNGTVIGIEANPQSIEKLKEIAADIKFDCEFIFVNKACYSEKAKAKLFLSRGSGSWSRLELVPGAASVQEQGAILVDVDKIDNILAEIGIAPERISFVNVTINGAEYETLKGMTGLLERSENISITVIAGRQGGDLGEIDHKPDYVVISDYLADFGLTVKFKRFSRGGFGYVMGTKGNAKFFI